MSESLYKQWLDRAGQDLTVARLVLQEDFTAHACFLAQQCIEKSLKAFLIAAADRYPKTHKLVDLLVECSQLKPSFAQFEPDCISIDQYYIPTRYPDGVPGQGPLGMPDSSAAQRAVSSAAAIFEFVRRSLDRAKSAGTPATS